MPNYTATIPNPPTLNEDGAQIFNILFTPDDGSEATTLEWITIDPNTLPQAVADKIGQLQNNSTIAANMKTFLASFQAGQVITPPTPPTPAAVTPQQQYQEDVETLQQLIAQKTAFGINPTTDSDVLALQAVVAGEYDPSFVVTNPITSAALTASKNNLANKTSI